MRSSQSERFGRTDIHQRCPNGSHVTRRDFHTAHGAPAERIGNEDNHFAIENRHEFRRSHEVGELIKSHVGAKEAHASGNELQVRAILTEAERFGVATQEYLGRLEIRLRLDDGKITRHPPQPILFRIPQRGHHRGRINLERSNAPRRLDAASNR